MLEAAVALRRRGQPSGGDQARPRVRRASSLRELSGQLAELSGQLTMPLDMRRAASTSWSRRRKRPKRRGDLATAEKSLHDGAAGGCERSGPAVQSRQRLRCAGTAGRGQDRLADRGRARSGIRRGLVQSRHGGGGRGADRPRHRRIPPRGAGAARLCRRPFQSRAAADEAGPLRRGLAAVGAFSGARTQRPAGEDGQTCRRAMPHAASSAAGQAG